MMRSGEGLSPRPSGLRQRCSVVHGGRPGMNRDNNGETVGFVPEIVTPAQYYAVRRGSRESEPLQRLMIALLADAIRCYQTAETAKTELRRQLFREARWWLFEEKFAGPFSFEAVCEALVIDPERLRRGLKRQRAVHRAGSVSGRVVRRPRMRQDGKMRPSRARASRSGSRLT